MRAGVGECVLERVLEWARGCTPGLAHSFLQGGPARTRRSCRAARPSLHCPGLACDVITYTTPGRGMVEGAQAGEIFCDRATVAELDGVDALRA